MKRMSSFNEWLALKITGGVGTMACAYAFAALALVSLPQNVDSLQHFILWTSSEFLQLVLLSILMVGQNLSAAKHDAVAESLSDLHDKHDALHAKQDAQIRRGDRLNARVGALLELDPEHREPMV